MGKIEDPVRRGLVESLSKDHFVNARGPVSSHAINTYIEIIRAVVNKDWYTVAIGNAELINGCLFHPDVDAAEIVKHLKQNLLKHRA